MLVELSRHLKTEEASEKNKNTGRKSRSWNDLKIKAKFCDKVWNSISKGIRNEVKSPRVEATEATEYQYT